ncbi:response regulator transcription factor [Chryseolinea sp. T2]|uniref:response regulator transcription factor n=1 Tax=Chryseolinea sp. T2 TaxID=3129255 RepID=UPI0030779F34
MCKVEILIADDHAMIRQGVRSLLSRNSQWNVVGESVNGREAIQHFHDLRPDLMILDISMPEVNGMEVAKHILTGNSDAKIIILSMYNDDDYISKCLEHGVRGYVVKSETGDQLEEAVQTVLRGDCYFSSEVQKSILKHYSGNSRKKATDSDIRLTAREVEIVQLISEGLTNQEMADRLFISARTVETHRANLMKKVGVKNAIELVKKVDQLGLI